MQSIANFMSDIFYRILCTGTKIRYSLLGLFMTQVLRVLSIYVLVPFIRYRKNSALLLCPCLFCPSDNVWRSRRTDAPLCAHFSTVISPSWITEQISVGKCAHRGASACWEHQTSFKIVTWTKQTWKNITTQSLESN